MPGVSTVVKGTTTGTITDADGNFSLQVQADAKTLVFSFVGMVAQEIAITGQTSFKVVMAEDAIGIEEVVAVGYGTMKKSDLTGSVTTVKVKDLTMRPTPAASALQGQAAGVLVRTESSAPGGKSSITIRGINSVRSGSDPLFVVDGVPLTDINSIAPEDIESLEVLKDASATAIYGSRGANGVIWFTSKKGEKGTPVVSFSTRYTVEKMPKINSLMNAEEFITVYTQYEKNIKVAITKGLDYRLQIPIKLMIG